MGPDENNIQVSEVMTRRPVVIVPGKTIVEASSLMKRHSVGSLIIVDDKKVLGIITLNDIVFRVVAKSLDPSKLLVEDVMSKNVVSILPTIDVRDAMELMNENGVKQLPVISQGELVGFLTFKDVLRLGPALADLTIERVRFQEESRQKQVQSIFRTEGLDIDDDLFN